MEKRIFFDIILRMIIEGYLPFAISIFLGLQNLKMQSIIDKINTGLTFIFTLIVLAFPIFTYIFLRSFKDKLSEERFALRYGAMYMEVEVAR